MEYCELTDDTEKEAYIDSLMEQAEPENTAKYWIAFSPAKLKENIMEDMNISFVKALLEKYGIHYALVKGKFWTLSMRRVWLVTANSILCVIDHGNSIAPLGWDPPDVLLLWQLEESGMVIIHMEDEREHHIKNPVGLYDPYKEELTSRKRLV